MKYVTKMGAYGLAVAAAFAVALAVLVSVSTTQTVEAATVQLPEGDGAPANDVAPGDTVQIAVNGKLARVSITDTADGVSASFVANGGQTISCSDATTTTGCDKNAAANAITVALKVDADSGEGFILLNVSGAGAATNTAQVTKVITVSKSGLVGSLAIKATAAADKTIPADGGTSNLTVTVKNASTPAGGLSAQSVSVITTHGTVGCTGSAGTTQTCGGTTGADGTFAVLLTGGGVEGQAVVTARLGTRTATATVTLFGSAKNLTAEPQQGSVEIGGSVFVVLTVTDGAGNPVSGQVITPVTSKEVVGPGDKPVLVVTSRATDGDPANDVGYNVDYIAAKAADSLPACGDDKDPATTEDFATAGTNAAGKCVVQVTAPEDTADSTKSATRGEHTLNFAIGTIKASATIEVAGKPSSISTDAPAMVDPGSVTTITVSVFDDEDVLVGITSVKVRKVDGGGLIEDEGAGGSEMTSNGQSKFTFIAPSSPGSSEILITAGTVNHRVPLQIGEAMEEPDEPEEPEEPAMPEGDATLSVFGNLGSFSGGSVADLHAAAEAACAGGAVIWAQDSAGDWKVYSTTAPALVNMGFSSAFADGIPARPVWVSSCEADSMESEG